MSGNNSNAEVQEVLREEKVIAYFVPSNVAAYVTEVLELALRNVPGVSVTAGTLAEIPVNRGYNIRTPSSQQAILPDVNVVSSTTARRGRKKSNEQDEKPCCEHKMAENLARKHGAPSPQPDGEVKVPRLLIEYPNLPYMVPVHHEFSDIGVPRNVVNFCYNAVFTTDPSEQLPNVPSTD